MSNTDELTQLAELHCNISTLKMILTFRGTIKERMGCMSVLILILFGGCGGDKTPPKSDTTAVATKPASDFSYQITKEYIIDQRVNWGVVSVELSRKLSDDEITALAKQLREVKSNYGNLTLTFLVNGMSDSGPAYATVIFAPDMKVERWGSTDEEQQKAALLAKQNLEGKIIGKWHENQYVPETYVIFERGGKTYLREIFERGITDPGSSAPSSNDDQELIKKKVHGSTRFYEKDGRFDGFYVINKVGNLELYDNEGYITTGIKIQ